MVRLALSHMAAYGSLTISRKKTGHDQHSIVDNADLLACIAALLLPAASEPVNLLGRSTVPFLRTVKDKPFDSHYFAKCWRDWADAAGLPKDFVIHGGRKSFAVDAVDNESQTDRDVFRHYARKADGKRGGARASTAVGAARAKRVA